MSRDPNNDHPKDGRRAHKVWSRARFLAACAVLIGVVSASRAAHMTWRSTLLHWSPDLTSGVGRLGAWTAVAFLPDGKSVATASEDERVRYWDVLTGRLLRTVALDRGTLPRRSPQVGSPVAFAPDGKTLATQHASGDGIGMKIWDAHTGACRLVIPGGTVVAFSPDSRRVAVVTPSRRPGSARSTVSVRVLISEQPDPAPLSVPGRVRAVSFSPDGAFLATAGEANAEVRNGMVSPVQGDVRIWKISTGKLVRALAPVPSPAVALAWSPTGTLLAVGGERDTVTLWNVATGAGARSLQAMIANRQGTGRMGPARVHSLAYSPDSLMLAGAAAGVVHLWNGRTGEYQHSVRLLSPPRISDTPAAGTLTFSPDGRWLAAPAERRQAVTVWHVR